MLRAALNAVLGDYLEERGNPLAIPLGFYQGGAALTLSPQALRDAHSPFGSRIVVLVHGMAQTEACWSFPNDVDLDYGSRLRAEVGLTPFYVRYNSGRHVWQNGRDLATALERLFSAAPVRIEEITLIGHSLGGLVIRSACHYASGLELSWIRRARRAFYLGSPHLGAPLEKAGNLVSIALGAIDDPVLRLLHSLAELRSAGVKDLRRGSLLEEDAEHSAPNTWARPRAVPLAAEMTHYFVAGTLTRNEKHWASLLLGDALVRVPSATAPARHSGLPADHSAILPGLSHMQLCRSQEVYARIRAWLDHAAATPPSEPARGKTATPGDTRNRSVAQAGQDFDELEGYGALLQDGIDRGVLAVQEVGAAISARPYDLLQQIPGLHGPTALVRTLHSSSARASYDTIRFVNQLVGATFRSGLAWSRRSRKERD